MISWALMIDEDDIGLLVLVLNPVKKSKERVNQYFMDIIDMRYVFTNH